MHSALQDIRRHELAQTRAWIKPPLNVLELGGGDGFQARQIADWGCTIQSIDVTDWPASITPYYPVQTYDGRHIPFADQSFDLIFSSNVLEHVPHLPELFSEMRRVLKPGGQMIHILPSTAWRFWTILTHYPNLVISRLRKQDPASYRPAEAVPKSSPASFGRRLWRALWPAAHGEYAGAFAELYFYSRRRWTRVFKEEGFAVKAIVPARLFYTGHMLFSAWSLNMRQRLAPFLGSAGHVYVLAKERA